MSSYRSYSPPPFRRLSNASAGSSRHQEELINAYEAEEERIINMLSRKLEQLRQEKIGLENTLEAESESHVNRLSRELSALRLAQHQLQQQQQQNQQHPSSQHNGNGNGTPVLSDADLASTSPETSNGVRALMYFPRADLGKTAQGSVTDPSPEALLETLRRENEALRYKLVDTEREFIRIRRLNDIYKEELIDHRRRLGLSIDNLVNDASDPLSQPTHQRRLSIPSVPRSTHSHGVPVPIPRGSTSRPHHHHRISSSSTSSIGDAVTPLSHSPSSSTSDFPLSPYPFSPGTSGPAVAASSYLSTNTDVTSPPSSASLANINAGLNIHGQPSSVATLGPGRGLTYPSVPPPSLSSSFGSPTVSFHMPHRSDAAMSPIEPLSRRNSNAAGTSRASRRTSLEFGARVAETGSLIRSGGGGRSRAGSQSYAPAAVGQNQQVLEATIESQAEVEVFPNDLVAVSEGDDGASSQQGAGGIQARVPQTSEENTGK